MRASTNDMKWTPQAGAFRPGLPMAQFENHGPGQLSWRRNPNAGACRQRLRRPTGRGAAVTGHPKHLYRDRAGQLSSRSIGSYSQAHTGHSSPVCGSTSPETHRNFLGTSSWLPSRTSTNERHSGHEIRCFISRQSRNGRVTAPPQRRATVRACVAAVSEPPAAVRCVRIFGLERLWPPGVTEHRRPQRRQGFPPMKVPRH